MIVLPTTGFIQFGEKLSTRRGHMYVLGTFTGVPVSACSPPMSFHLRSYWLVRSVWYKDHNGSVCKQFAMLLIQAWRACYSFHLLYVINLLVSPKEHRASQCNHRFIWLHWLAPLLQQIVNLCEAPYVRKLSQQTYIYIRTLSPLLKNMSYLKFGFNNILYVLAASDLARVAFVCVVFG